MQDLLLSLPIGPDTQRHARSRTDASMLLSISSLSRGVKSHKDIDHKKQNWFLYIYYTNRTVLGYLIAA